MLFTRCPLRVGALLFKFNNASLSSRAISTTSIRPDIFNIGKRMKKEQHYKKMDNIDPSYELIYKAPFEYMTALCRHVPNFSLLVVSAFGAMKLAMGVPVIEPGAEFAVGPIMSNGTELILIGAAFYIVNLGLTYAVCKYPLRIYKLEKQYCAIFEGFWPFSPRQYSFQQGDLRKTASNLSWEGSMYKMKDRKVLVFSHHFRRPIDFTDMLTK